MVPSASKIDKTQLCQGSNGLSPVEENLSHRASISQFLLNIYTYLSARKSVPGFDKDPIINYTVHRMDVSPFRYVLIRFILLFCCTPLVWSKTREQGDISRVKTGFFFAGFWLSVRFRRKSFLGDFNRDRLKGGFFEGLLPAGGGLSNDDKVSLRGSARQGSSCWYQFNEQ